MKKRKKMKKKRKKMKKERKNEERIRERTITVTRIERQRRNR